MRKVNLTELRRHLSGYLEAVRKGEPIHITQRGKVVARLLPAQDAGRAARRQLNRWRGTAVVGDVLSPIGDAWEAEHGRV